MPRLEVTMASTRRRVLGSNTRRRFLAGLGVGLSACFLWPIPAPAQRRWSRTGGPHPAPRPGITAAKVLTAAQLATMPDLIPLFDMVREIPEIVDGIRCQCGCSDPPDFYSLLSCYEGEAMARHCDICQGQARLAHRLHRAGNTLDEIREAIDARFG
jgi:hypothetical protein